MRAGTGLPLDTRPVFGGLLLAGGFGLASRRVLRALRLCIRNRRDGDLLVRLELVRSFRAERIGREAVCVPGLRLSDEGAGADRGDRQSGDDADAFNAGRLTRSVPNADLRALRLRPSQT